MVRTHGGDGRGYEKWRLVDPGERVHLESDGPKELKNLLRGEPGF